MAYQTSQGLASLGRNGDSMLVHMNPTEVAGLQSLAMSQGGSLTINPHTGLPEAFSLGGFFKSLLPMFAGAMTGGAGMPLWAGIAAGAVTGAATNKDRLMGALTGGLGGYGGYGLGQGLAAAGAPTVAPSITTAGGYVPGTVEGANTALNVAGTYNPALSPATTNAANAMKASGFMGSAGTGATGIDKSFLGGMDRLGSGAQQMGTGFKNIATGKEGAWDAFKGSFAGPGEAPISDLAGYGKIAMPIGGAALGGLEPSDIYGEPINMDEAKKKQAYDPNATLNLSGDTGLRLYAEGGTIATGGIRDLYGSSDNQNQAPLSRDGYGLGRLNQLGNQQSLSQAQTLGYAMGGPVSFADGGDSNKEDALGLPSLSPDMSMDPNAGANNSAMLQSVMGAMQPMQGMQGSTTAQGQMPDQSNDSLIAKVTANLKADPNYQPTNPIEASIVKQIKGTDPMQQGQPSLQGLGSIAPSQPMAPSFNPSVAMGPTYFAGMNAPRGYAEGGETSMNLDKLPTLNVNTGISSLGGTGGDAMYSFNDKAAFSPVGRMLLSKMPQSDRAKFIGSGMGGFFGLQERPKQDYYTSSGALTSSYAKGGYLDGQGDGMSDSIPATIEGKQPARLADGEFVVPADVVSHIGNGSSKAGSKRLYAMLDKVRKARTGHTKQGKQIKPEKYMPA
jgi:hypothetical protein